MLPTCDTPRILFILKRRPDGPYGTWCYNADGSPLDSGLSISVKQVSYALTELGIENKAVQVIDNNCIDREVTQYRPTIVIIEAFWVVPEKFEILRKLHPTVKWVIRNHSKMDFLSHEGSMIGWAVDYFRAGLTVASNSKEAVRDLAQLAVTAGADPSLSVYLPNYYKSGEVTGGFRVALATFMRRNNLTSYIGFKTDEINVGCFGAIRPLKNHLQQALASIEVATELGVDLNFYINATRVEGRAESILVSLRSLFARFPQHTLIEVPWMTHENFVEFIKTMDIVLQVSNSETFNIVAADTVSVGVPVVVSDEIPWLGTEFHADPNNVENIRKKMLYVLTRNSCGLVQAEQLKQLKTYCEQSKVEWANYLQ